MTTQATRTIATMTPVDCTEVAASLALNPGDLEHMVDPNNGGACYRFTMSDHGNGCAAYIDAEFVAVEEGGNPVWYKANAEANEDDTEALRLAVNGALQEP